MDIAQPLAARAMITLGKDLTFRDYAQGAYRMRGIGKGQTIVLFVVPEVSRLVSCETALGHGVTPDERQAHLAAMPELHRARAQLEDVTAWLLLNSVRSEKVQFPLWCMQCAQNVWRKRAFAQLGVRYDELGSVQPARSGSRGSLSREHSMGASPSAALTAESSPVRECLDIFREHVERDVSNAVPVEVDTRTQISQGAAQHNGKTGQVEQYDASAGRYLVQVGDGEVLRIRFDNLLQNARCTVVGMQNRPELNGKSATLVGFDEDKGRIHADIGGVGRASLQPANLRLKRAVANEADALRHPTYPLLFDPQTAGGLLAAVPAERVQACLDALRQEGYAEAAVVGEVIEMLTEGVCVPALVECVAD